MILSMYKVVHIILLIYELEPVLLLGCRRLIDGIVGQEDAPFKTQGSPKSITSIYLECS